MSARSRRDRADHQRQAPVHHQHFAKTAQHHVFGLQVAMDDSAGVGEGNGIAYLHPDFQVLRHGLPGDDPIPGSSLDVLHRVEERTPSSLPKS